MFHLLFGDVMRNELAEEWTVAQIHLEGPIKLYLHVLVSLDELGELFPAEGQIFCAVAREVLLELSHDMCDGRRIVRHLVIGRLQHMSRY